LFRTFLVRKEIIIRISLAVIIQNRSVGRWSKVISDPGLVATTARKTGKRAIGATVFILESGRKKAGSHRQFPGARHYQLPVLFPEIF